MTHPSTPAAAVSQYRKKPVVIEAFQMTKERRSDNKDWPDWLSAAWNMDFAKAGAVSCADFPNSDGADQLVIRTLEGVMYVGFGDYIIRGVKGELYACKPDIFAKTYEPVEAAATREAALIAERDQLRAALILMVRTHDEPAETLLQEVREQQWLEKARAALSAPASVEGV